MKHYLSINDIDSVSEWVEDALILKKKPLAIGEYIRERFPSMRHDVECELKLGNI